MREKKKKKKLLAILYLGAKLDAFSPIKDHVTALPITMSSCDIRELISQGNNKNTAPTNKSADHQNRQTHHGYFTMNIFNTDFSFKSVSF